MKPDSKSKYQDSKFRKQLQNARKYKRRETKKPKGKKIPAALLFFTDELLWYTLGSFIVLGGLAYLIFFPNILYIRSIVVQGLSPANISQAENLSMDYLLNHTQKGQQNIFVFPKNQLTNYLLTKDQTILSISSIKRIFPNKILVVAIPRIATFIVTTPQRQLIVTNDGIVKDYASNVATSSLLHLTALTIDTASTTAIGEKLLNQNLITNIQLLKNLMTSDFQSASSAYEISNTGDTDITAYVKGNYKIIFDSSQNLPLQAQLAAEVVRNQTDSQIKTLYYIDMRFQDKAYVCYSNTPCSEPIPTPTPFYASSTSPSLTSTTTNAQ